MKWGMEMETKATVEIARVISGKEPQPGQKNRSSGNFSTENLPAGTKYLKWEVIGGGDPDFISFNVMEDKSAAIGQVLYQKDLFILPTLRMLPLNLL